MKKILIRLFMILIGAYIVFTFIIILFIVYAIFTFINQQEALNQYNKSKEELAKQIQEQKDYKEELNESKDNVNSIEFIEQTAREKLDMYLPNEKVYIDQGM